MRLSTFHHVLAGVLIGLIVAFFTLSLAVLVQVRSVNNHLLSIDETLNQWELTE